MKTSMLVAAAGLVFAAFAPERAAADPVPRMSATEAFIVAQTSNRCTRLLRRCNRGNEQACQNYRIECRGVRPIY